jgi:hypothetical protein
MFFFEAISQNHAERLHVAMQPRDLLLHFSKRRHQNTAIIGGGTAAKSLAVWLAQVARGVSESFVFMIYSIDGMPILFPFRNGLSSPIVLG